MAFRIRSFVPTARKPIILSALASIALFTVVVTQADEPAPKKPEKTTVAFDRLLQASALVERLNERVKAERASLEQAEADLLAAQKLADELRKLAVEEQKDNSQRQYQADKRIKELSGEKVAPKVPPVFIGPLGDLQD